MGTEENAERLQAGDFWRGNLDDDIIPLRHSAEGAPYHHSYVMRLIRLVHGYGVKGGGLIGDTFNPYMMEEVYVAVRGTNGCVNKVGAVWSANFNANVGYHLPLARALRELKRQRQGG